MKPKMRTPVLIFYYSAMFSFIGMHLFYNPFFMLWMILSGVLGITYIGLDYIINI
jgi:hypothetical protein